MVVVGGGGRLRGWVQLVGGGRCELWTLGGPMVKFQIKTFVDKGWREKVEWV